MGKEKGNKRKGRKSSKNSAVIIKEDMMVALTKAMILEAERREKTLRELELWYLVSKN